MCGLVGLLAKNPTHFKSDKKDIFNDLLYADTLRGVDSTGIALVDKDQNIFTYKRALPAFDFLSLPAYTRLINKIDPKIYLGHNRAATHGSVLNHNAHPFTVDHITLAHNGTINNHKDLPDGKDFAVDSHYVAHSIAKFGYEETLKNIRGAFALTWYDSKEDKFFMVRNTQRPLSYATYGKGDVLVYASEGEMLPWVIARNKKVLDDNWWIELEDQKLYVFDTEDLLNPEIRDVDFHTYTTTPSSYKPSTSKKVEPITKNGLRPSVDALEDLGLKLGNSLEMSIEEVEANCCVLSINPPHTIPKSKKVDCLAFHKPFKEAEMYEHVMDTAVGIIVGCRNYEGSDDYTIYLDNNLVFKKDKSEIVTLDDGDYAKEWLRRQEEALQNDEEFPQGVDSIPYLPGPNKTFLTFPQYSKLTQDGCCECTGPIVESDAWSLGWTMDSQPICAECLERHEKDVDSGTPSYLN